MSAAIEIIAASDVGNGHLKELVYAPASGLTEVDLPSGVRSTTLASPSVPVSVSEALKVIKGDFYNELDASFDSPLVPDTHRKIFGRAGLETQGNRYVEFQLDGGQSKVDQPLSKILVLGTVAAKAVQEYVALNGVFPEEEIVAHVYAGLALPVNEYVAHHRSYASLFTDANPHLVTIKNFDQPITVRLVFKEVRVLPEGASAQFAINDKAEKLFPLLLADLRERDPEAVPADVTPEDLLAVTDTISLDVGEGTSLAIVFGRDPETGKGRFNAGASSALTSGYGTVLNNAIEVLDHQNPPLHYPSRKALGEFLRREPSKFKRADYDRTVEAVEAQVDDLVAGIVDKFLETIALVGSTTEASYVYGGGSGPIKEKLYPALLKAAAGRFPVFYLDSSYSRVLNREGLYLAAKHAKEASK